MIQGGNLYLYLGNSIVAGTKADKITSGCETLEIASATQGQWREFVAGRKEWSCTVNFLVSAYLDIASLAQVGLTAQVAFRNADGYPNVNGTAILTHVEIQATKGNIATGVFQLKGSGTLTFPQPVVIPEI